MPASCLHLPSPLPGAGVYHSVSDAPSSAHTGCASQRGVSQTLAVAVYNHYMRIAHEEQRRKTAHEKQVAADGAARIRDAAATDDATAAAAMTSEQRPGPSPAAHGDMLPGRGKGPVLAGSEFPTAIGVPTNGPLEAWGCVFLLTLSSV